MSRRSLCAARDGQVVMYSTPMGCMRVPTTLCTWPLTACQSDLRRCVFSRGGGRIVGLRWPYFCYHGNHRQAHEPSDERVTDVMLTALISDKCASSAIVPSGTKVTGTSNDAPNT